MSAIHLPLQRPAPGPASADAAPAGDPGWWQVLVSSGSRAALAAVLSLVLWSLLPAALGWSPRVIMSGSMEPRIHVGDVVVDRPVDPNVLTEGRIVTVTDPDHPEKTRTHRLQEFKDNGELVLKGDANEAADSTPVASDDVLGVAAIRVPYVGLPVTWVAQRQFVPAALLVVVLITLALGATTPLRLGENPVRGDGPTDPPEDRDDHIDDGRPADSDDEKSENDELTVAAPSVGLQRAERAPCGVRRGQRLFLALAAAVFTSVGFTLPHTGAAFSATTLNSSNGFAAAASFTPYRDAVLADGPQLYWRFEESSGTSVDDTTANNRDGLVAGSAGRGADGALVSEAASSAITFAGGGLVTARSSTSTSASAFSIEVWVRTTSTAGGALFSFGSGSGSSASTTLDRVLYLSPDGRVRFGVGTSKTVVASNQAVNNGAWHHVVATYVTGTNGMKLYVHGAFQSQGRATAGLASGYWRAGGEQMTGWSGNPGTSLLNAGVDEAAVYSGKALSSTQVTAHYQAGTTP